MKTVERATILARAAEFFPLLGPVTPDELIELVRLELGHAEILDGFRPYAGGFSHAVPNDPLLHVISGNTPHAGLQSLMRGLLLGAHNFVKLPSGGLREIDDFIKLLPASLAGKVATAVDLPDQWLSECRTSIIFGSDATIAAFSATIARRDVGRSSPSSDKPRRRFRGHERFRVFGSRRRCPFQSEGVPLST